MSISGLDPLTPASTALAGLGDDELRALKVALQACFPNIEGLIEKGTGNGGPVAADVTALWDRMDAVEAATGSGSGILPVGAIAMWSGTVANIPSGWALCDGSTSNGFATPDLRDRFAVGAGDLSDGSEYDPGDTGGQSISSDSMLSGSGGSSLSTSVTIADHTLVKANIPDHDHYLFDAGNGSNTTHPGTGFAGGIAQSHPSSDDRRYTLSEAAGSIDQGKTGSVIGIGGTVTDVEHSASVDIPAHTHECLPAYYALAFIAYVGV